MGFDMYAKSVPATAVGYQQIDIDLLEDVEVTHLAQWRKFNQLHGWMEDLYRSKGGEKEFNCVAVRLMPEDLDNLAEWLLVEDKTSRPGFFFGTGDIYPEDITTTQKFVQDAHSAIAEGQAVLYDSWW